MPEVVAQSHCNPVTLASHNLLPGGYTTGCLAAAQLAAWRLHNWLPPRTAAQKHKSRPLRSAFVSVPQGTDHAVLAATAFAAAAVSCQIRDIL